MKVFHRICLFCIVVIQSFVLTSCSTEQIYTGIRDNRISECHELNGAVRDQCLAQYEESYAEFKQRRESQIAQEE